ncbi:PREDICTED: UDP-N-acetylglucosamine transferase subunit ALG14 homolog [Drosophila arizonae]|uniref:UDP-N-acetylglucosamine transferase subunit ALG14 n=1 Tax=Drosophila arizonae TaxID=7263 RepID=A0ABM1PVP3_DROAR|nr:PREDICTED: UDP-N-acetylglucosamine transferase subunit ALG14 homolog [Drosophila arizonae]
MCPNNRTAQPIYVILGSGGHTAEMCKINQALMQHDDLKQYQSVRYIVANSDDTSEKQIRSALPALKDSDFIRVPRSRSVGQSWLTSIFTTLWALLWSCWLVWRDRPKLVLCNGPGTCVPYCYAAYLWRLLGRLPAHSKIVFVESYCRVETLSLSGRLLLPLVDMFVVHWPALATRYAKKSNLRYFGRIL